jgi:hypothetical protein
MGRQEIAAPIVIIDPTQSHSLRESLNSSLTLAPTGDDHPLKIK